MWVVPKGLYDAMPNKDSYSRFYPTADKKSNDGMFIPRPGQLIEFATADSAKAFVTEKGCSGMDCSNKPFLSYFGSNSVLIQDLTKSAVQVLGIAGGVIAVIAALILMGMIGRVIGDSRRETAVFRAIGAKRNDIRAIYTMYTIFLTLLIAVSALAIGTAGALWVDSRFSAEATVRAQLTFVGADGSQQFHLIGIWWQALALIVALAVAAGLVSMLLPVSRNLARSPIKDMRDDT
jgi:ABC-type antimicrobial peptide transport system permease subunit